MQLDAARVVDGRVAGSARAGWWAGRRRRGGSVSRGGAAGRSAVAAAVDGEHQAARDLVELAAAAPRRGRGRAPGRSGSRPGRARSGPRRGRSRSQTVERWLTLKLPSGWACPRRGGAAAQRQQRGPGAKRLRLRDAAERAHRSASCEQRCGRGRQRRSAPRGDAEVPRGFGPQAQPAAPPRPRAAGTAGRASPSLSARRAQRKPARGRPARVSAHPSASAERMLGAARQTRRPSRTARGRRAVVRLEQHGLGVRRVPSPPEQRAAARARRPGRPPRPRGLPGRPLDLGQQGERGREREPVRRRDAGERRPLQVAARRVEPCESGQGRGKPGSDRGARRGRRRARRRCGRAAARGRRAAPARRRCSRARRRRRPPAASPRSAPSRSP